MQQTISVNGDVKKQELYQVQLGPDGKPVKTLINQSSSSSNNRRHGIRHRITERYEDYGKQVEALAQSYTQPVPGKVQQLYAQGHVALQSGGAPDYVALAISNYVKPGDSVVVTFTENPKALSSIAVSSYLSKPTDVVTMQVRYAKLPDGTNYASSVNVDGQTKNLTVVQQNSNFQLRAH